MDEYISRDALLEMISERLRNTCNGSLSCIQMKRLVESVPTADVAPKSEVAMQKAMLLDAIDTFRNLLCIESWLDYEDTYVVSIDDVNRIHGELKKKYTEGEE